MLEMIFHHQIITKQQTTSYLLKAGIKNLIYSVPDEWATTKSYIVHFRNKYWKLINNKMFSRNFAHLLMQNILTFKDCFCGKTLLQICK